MDLIFELGRAGSVSGIWMVIVAVVLAVGVAMTCALFLRNIYIGLAAATICWFGLLHSTIMKCMYARDCLFDMPFLLILGVAFAPSALFTLFVFYRALWIRLEKGEEDA